MLDHFLDCVVSLFLTLDNLTKGQIFKVQMKIFSSTLREGNGLVILSLSLSCNFSLYVKFSRELKKFPATYSCLTCLKICEHFVRCLSKTCSLAFRHSSLWLLSRSFWKSPISPNQRYGGMLLNKYLHLRGYTANSCGPGISYVLWNAQAFNSWNRFFMECSSFEFFEQILPKYFLALSWKLFWNTDYCTDFLYFP